MTCHTGMPSGGGLLDRVEIVAHVVDAAAGGRDELIEAGEIAHELMWTTCQKRIGHRSIS